MAMQFQILSKIEPFVIDQVAFSVLFNDFSKKRIQPWIDRFKIQLEQAPTQTLGFFCEDLEETQDDEARDAIVLSLRNELR